MQEKLSFKLEIFEGPLELLLSLIEKNKVNIYDIPISFILEQYLGYISVAKELDLNLASEFLTMAAQLIYIKSKFLLPIDKDDDEVDPRKILVEMLIEYKRYKQIVPILQEQNSGNNIFVRQPLELDFGKRKNLKYDLQQLESAYYDILKKKGRKLPPPVTSFKGIIGKEAFPVGIRVTSIFRSLSKFGRLSFIKLFRDAHSRSEIVATFLAVLELSKSKHVTIKENSEEDFELVFSPKRKNN